MTACAPDVSRKEPNRRFSFRFDRRRRSVVNFAVPFVGALIVMTLVAHAQETKIAYAHVLGEIEKRDRDRSGGQWFFCFKLTFKPRNVIATIANDPTAPDQGSAIIEVSLPPLLSASCAKIKDPDSIISTFDLSTNTSHSGHSFYVRWSS